MLLVIFGAGASYDSVAARRPSGAQSGDLHDRMPLAHQLFDDRPGFIEDLNRFPECKRIVQELRVPRTGGQFEEFLRKLQSEADTYPDRHIQLAAIRFYLRNMLWRCEDRWFDQHHGVTNYSNLLDQLNMWVPKQQKILLVTFNYDRMLERALEQFGCSFKEISEYTQHPRFKLFKLHGSVNWGRRVLNYLGEWKEQNHKNHETMKELIQRASSLMLSDQYKVIDHPDVVVNGGAVYFPALALPIDKKQGFDCPQTHLDLLCQDLKDVIRIMTIGWRGSEAHFLELLKTNLPRSASLMVVAKDGTESHDIGKHLESNGIVQALTAYPGGFSDFVPSRNGEKFLRF